jgi:two-component system, NtrC family, sensor kinase
VVSVESGEVVIGGRAIHLSVIVLLFLGLTLVYYIELAITTTNTFLDEALFSGVRDLHRTFFLVPIVYAALIFGRKGTILASMAFLGIVLPRAFFLSPYPNSLLRASISVVSSAIIGMLVAAWRKQLKTEREDKERLAAAYEELKKYHSRLEEHQAMLIQAEKLASMGQLAASIAHEVNNPLSGVLVYIQLMTKKMSEATYDRETILHYLSRIDFEVTRSTKLIRNLLDFSSQSAPSMQETDINEVVDRALDLAIHARSPNTTLEKAAQTIPRIVTDPEQLQEVLINLIMNGLQAMPEGGTLTVCTDIVKGEARIAVGDTGCGIPPENLGKLFIPFFSTKKEVKGVGLGLAVSHGIIERLKGRIEVESTVGKGSTFTIYLPTKGRAGIEDMAAGL